MKAFFLGSVVALVLGIGSGVVYNYVGVQTAARYAPKGVQLPHYAAQPLISGELASSAAAAVE